MGFWDALQRIAQDLGLHGTISDFIVVFMLIFGRVASAISLAPFLGGQAVAQPVKVGLAGVVSFLLMPDLVRGLTPPSGTVLVVALLVKEVMIGLTIGLIAQFMFYAVQAAGALIDVQRGMDQPGLHVPQLPGNVSATGVFYFQTAIIIFLFLNGHLMYIRALADSFHRLPVFGFPPLPSPASVAELMARVSAQVFVVALQLSAPVLLTLFLVDAIFGAIGKIASQVNVHHESQPVKALVGLLVLVPSFAFIFSRSGELLSQMIWNIYNVIAKMS